MLRLTSCSGYCLTLLVVAGFMATVAGPLPAETSSLRRTAIVRAVEQCRGSVVNIHGRKLVTGSTNFAPTATDSPRQVNGMGTGIVIDPRGYILTNYHVVQDVERIQVSLSDQRTLIARLVANDTTTDLAVIKIDTDEPLPVITIGSSSDLMAGEPVIAVGNAYGYEHTVTRGIISALHRSVQVSDDQKYHDLIQTDASINPGNSGGPLLNIDGQLIGINVAVRVGAQGIGFAIPVNEAMEVAARLMNIESIDRLAHGVVGETVDQNGVAQFTVRSVRADSPAAKAGIQAGDVITRVDDVDVRRALDFERAMLGRVSGEEVAVTAVRQSQQIQASLVLTPVARASNTVSDLAWDLLGLRLAPIPQRTFRQYTTRYSGGLKVVAVRTGSPAEQQGIMRGDLLVGMHKWETTSLDNLTYILTNNEFLTTQPADFYIVRGGETYLGQIRVASRP